MGYTKLSHIYKGNVATLYCGRAQGLKPKVLEVKQHVAGSYISFSLNE